MKKKIVDNLEMKERQQRAIKNDSTTDVVAAHYKQGTESMERCIKTIQEMEMPFWKHYILDVKKAFSRKIKMEKLEDMHP